MATDITVIGGTGKTGRRVVSRLREHGLAPRVASRTSPVRFDWDDAGTWVPALRGASAAYVAYAPDLAVPGADEQVARLAALATEEGLDRLVLLSGRGEPEAQRAEAAAAAEFPGITVVRASWFMQDFTEAFLADGVRGGELVLPVDPSVREPFVDADDIADVAVRALTEDGLQGRVFEVTGPEALTMGEACGLLEAALGSEVRFVSVPWAAYAVELRALGVSDAEVELVGYLLTEVLDGRNERTADGVEQALGRPPRDFPSFAAAAAAAAAAVLS
ncbi:uncharacterized protein YbjT (DUF2867 family) [Motilibacter rhizosphaerae]|uniref:Uncharacterized protein YbjT (DUF2867 family) n=1 Tax=Motilibacter rhizosphaerae TaxID=598652 RepID=A0A4Q7NSX5_9ACTN|nr:NmrA family transcriptional regulator [Motilibacter rhizosphaerae]RZS90084.1 uncharacterized protein YbjT (DUF2867 family) [Motilibacter rhizosphaerae]